MARARVAARLFGASVLALSIASAHARAETLHDADARVSSDGGKEDDDAGRKAPFQTTLRGRLQLRDEYDAPASGAATNELTLYRARVEAKGKAGSERLDYALQLGFGRNDLSGAPTSPLFDAYVSYELATRLRLRAGQFLVPIDRSRATLYSSSQLVDRPLVVGELSLGRSVGVKLSSDDLFGLDERLGFHLAVLSGEGRGHVDGAPGFLYVTRLVVRPFGGFDDESEGDLSRDRRHRLSIGMGGAFNHAASQAKSAKGDPFEKARFDYVHAAADALYKYGGLSLFAEVLLRDVIGAAVLRTHRGDEPSEEWARTAWGYFVQAGWMFADDLELAGRWGELRTTRATDPALEERVRERGREASAGISWYIDGHDLKLQLDYTYQFGERIGLPRQRARVQLQATF